VFFLYFVGVGVGVFWSMFFHHAFEWHSNV